MTRDLDRLAELSAEVRRLEGVRSERDALLVKMSHETDDAGKPVYRQVELVESSGLTRERIRIITRKHSAPDR